MFATHTDEEWVLGKAFTLQSIRALNAFLQGQFPSSSRDSNTTLTDTKILKQFLGRLGRPC